MNEIRDIKFLETSSGKVLFNEWYNSLKNPQTRRVIAGKLRQLQNVEFKNYKSIGKGVFELRIFYGAGYRVYFAFENEQIVVLIAGGDKNTQEKDINRARLLWRDYINAA
jgi:putative addiction module killer protein